MDAAQILTAQEIVRQCEQLARMIQQNGSSPASGRHLRLADPVTEPIPVIQQPDAPTDPDSVEESDSARSLPDLAGPLTEREREILAFEAQWWKRPGAKERAIVELLDMPVSRYYQTVNALLDKPAARHADPLLIKRLRRARASRQRMRAAQQRGIELH